MSSLLQNIGEETEKLSDTLLTLRRKLHQIPEIGLEEYETSDLIAQVLKEEGIAFQRVGKTGIVADINPHHSGSYVAFRADMDGLKVTEASKDVVASRRQGFMHACGHDGHITVGLGVAMVVNRLKEQIPCRVRLLFQPGEEGWGGARLMAEQGVVSHPSPDAIFGLHIMPSLKSGTIGAKSGTMMSGGDRFRVRFQGVQGHGSTPFLAVNPIVMATEAVYGFSKLCSSQMDPRNPVVISVCKIQAGSAFNVIPAEATIEGTTRYIDPGMRAVLKEKMEDTVQAIALTNGGMAEFEYEDIFAPTINDSALTGYLKETVETCYGPDRFVSLPKSDLISEDFSEYLQFSPGLYFFAGTGNEEKGCIYPLHSPHYKLDEEILPNLVMLVAALIGGFDSQKANGGTKGGPVCESLTR